MKVVHLVPAMEQGGVESVVCDLNRILVRAGEQSVVVSMGGRLSERIVADGGRHLVLDLKSKNPLTYFSRALRLRSLLRKERPDVVCAHSRVPAWLFVWANRKLDLKWITYSHGANSVSLYSKVMTKGDLVIAPSQFLANFLKSNYEFDVTKIRVIGNAVDFERFNPKNLDEGFIDDKRREWGISREDFVVMSIGRITPLKGFDELVKSMPSDMKLVIVGGSDRHHLEYERQLKQMAGTNVIFAGQQSKIPECISMASVVVSANVKKPESFGLSMAEAIAMNVPVVAKSFGGALEVVEDGINGVLTEDGDFVSALRKVRLMQFGNIRDSAVRRFSLDVMAKKTLSAYGQLCGGTSGVQNR